MPLYLPWLQQQVMVAGGRHVVRRLAAREEVLDLSPEVGSWDTAPDPAETAAILQRCTEIAPLLKRARVLETVVGLRPGRRKVGVQLDEDLLPVSVITTTATAAPASPSAGDVPRRSLGLCSRWLLDPAGAHSPFLHSPGADAVPRWSGVGMETSPPAERVAGAESD